MYLHCLYAYTYIVLIINVHHTYPACIHQADRFFFFFTMIMEIPPFPLTSRVDDILLNESVCDRSGANNCALLSFEFCVQLYLYLMLGLLVHVPGIYFFWKFKFNLSFFSDLKYDCQIHCTFTTHWVSLCNLCVHVLLWSQFKKTVRMAGK